MTNISEELLEEEREGVDLHDEEGEPEPKESRAFRTLNNVAINMIRRGASTKAVQMVVNLRNRF